MREATIIQIRIMSSRKNVKLIFWLLMGFIFLNFFVAVNKYWGMDVVEMYEPMQLRFLTDRNYEYGMKFCQLFPILVVIPVGFSFLDDSDSNEMVYLRSRIGGRKYAYSKLLAAFIVSFLTFFIPLILEIILFCASFSFEATGDLSGGNAFEDIVQIGQKEYLFNWIYRDSALLHAIITTVFVSTVSAVLGVFSMAVSTLKLGLKVMVFLPVYILLYIIDLFETMFELDYSTNYIKYLSFYNESRKSLIACTVLMLLLLLISVALMHHNGERDWLK